MKNIIEGKAFVFGNNLDTDQIYPGQYLELSDTEDIKKHVLEGVAPNFINVFQPGDSKTSLPGGQIENKHRNRQCAQPDHRRND